jgi:hypothetical protein
MYIAGRLVFLELTKTGCSHVNGLLSALIPGQRVGKHNVLTATPANRLVVGSVRNPWDWYVSLWAFGCMKKGLLYSRLTTAQHTRSGFKRFLASYPRKFANIQQALAAYRAFARHRAELWRDSYRDGYDVQCFRNWLGLMSDPASCFELSEEYGQSAISRLAGLMTFRYMWLYSLDRKSLLEPNAFEDIESLRDFDSRHNIMQAVIRIEHLEDDFLSAVARAGYALTPAHMDFVFEQRANKRNQSRRLPSAKYYDSQTIDIVEKREALIIGKYGYMTPTTSA